MSVISKVNEKIEAVISTLPDNYQFADFYYKFISMYPKDYEKCWDKFLKEELTSNGGRHPMQHPKKHLHAALNSYLGRFK
ncbi:MAG: hypothetical protein KH375_05105 [Alistipes sp.]|jgi:hypothetical protein|nr:hypothetical protein [Alistipes sp.]